MLLHTAADTFTGALYCASVETLLLKVGIGENLLNENFERYHLLATESAIKNTWEFMWHRQLAITHDIELPKLRENDTPLMTIFVSLGVEGDTLQMLNKCILSLNVFQLSDMYNQQGTSINLFLLQGMKGPVANNFGWPRQGEPTNRDWEESKHYIKIAHERCQTTQRLGGWLINESTMWHFAPHSSWLYRKEQNTWISYSLIGRTRTQYYQPTGKVVPIGKTLPAHIVKFQDLWV